MEKRVAWNKGRIIGQKAPLKQQEIWAIRPSPNAPWGFVEVKVNTSLPTSRQIRIDKSVQEKGYYGLTGPEEIKGINGPTNVRLFRLTAQKI